MDGWISIHRKITENQIWKKRPFSYGQAWIDLILMASHKDTKMIFNGEIIKVARGSFITSQEKLKKRWGWARNYFDRYFRVLKSDNMILTENRANQGTCITICNYDTYQKPEQTNGQTGGQTASKPPANGVAIINNGNNENNGKKDIEARKLAFKTSVLSFKEKYRNDMLKAFFDYWTEPNRSNTKMRFELEKTWEIGKRLGRWAANEKPSGDNP